MANRRGTNPLGEWIDKVGVNIVAQAFCLERSTVRKWRDGSQLPKALHMYAIVKLSHGVVKYEDMIDVWADNNPEEFQKLGVKL